MDRIILERHCENPIDRAIALVTAAKASRALGIKAPPVKFFLPSDSDEIMGFYRDGVVYINARLNEHDIEFTTVHELRHYYQSLDSVLRRQSRECRERDAMVFELQWGV